ncbi:MAG: hypothetical protein ACOC3C_02580 [Candidatus Thorarchaeota archaeon]
MKDWCVMIGGPCRGKNCDFWAQIKIKKKPVEEMVEDILTRVETQNEESLPTPKQAIQEYWDCLGVKNLNRLRKEKPEIFAKMKEVEQLVLNRIKE